MNFLRYAIFCIIPLFVFSENNFGQILPDDCPFFGGLNSEDPELEFKIVCEGNKGNEKICFLCHNISFDFSENSTYDFLVYHPYIDHYSVTTLKKIKGEIIDVNKKHPLSNIIQTSDGAYPGALQMLGFNNKETKIMKLVGFIPYCPKVSSKLDKANIYSCFFSPSHADFFLMGEDFMPNEFVMISYYDEDELLFEENFIANNNGRIYRKLSFGKNISKGGMAKILVHRRVGKDDSMCLKFYWGDSYLNEEKNLFTGFLTGENEHVVYSTSRSK